MYEGQRKVRSTFKMMDRNGSGGLDVREAAAGFQKLGLELPLNVVAKLVETFDTKRNGELDYGEFLKLLQASASITS